MDEMSRGEQGGGVTASVGPTSPGPASEPSLNENDDSAELFPRYFSNVFDDNNRNSTTGRDDNNNGGPIEAVGSGAVADSLSSSMADNDNNNTSTMEEREEDFLIQQTAQRLARASQNGNSGNGTSVVDLHFDGSILSSQDGSLIMRKPWHDENHDEQRRQMEVEM
jgi:hypothetical protein